LAVVVVVVVVLAVMSVILLLLLLLPNNIDNNKTAATFQQLQIIISGPRSQAPSQGSLIELRWTPPDYVSGQRKKRKENKNPCLGFVKNPLFFSV
jgi:hypothetical protein